MRRWYDFQSWLGRTTDSAKSGVVRKTAAYDAVWKTPPLVRAEPPQRAVCGGEAALLSRAVCCRCPAAATFPVGLTLSLCVRLLRSLRPYGQRYGIRW